MTFGNQSTSLCLCVWRRGAITVLRAQGLCEGCEDQGSGAGGTALTQAGAKGNQDPGARGGRGRQEGKGEGGRLRLTCADVLPEKWVLFKCGLGTPNLKHIFTEQTFQK